MSHDAPIYQFANYFSMYKDDRESIDELKGSCQEEEGGPLVEYNEVPALSDEVIIWIQENTDIAEIVLYGMEMSVNHIGGDNMVMLVKDTIEALTKGYTWLYTFYGSGSEAIIIAAKEPIHKIDILKDVFDYLFVEGNPFDDEVNRIFQITGEIKEITDV